MEEQLTNHGDSADQSIILHPIEIDETMTDDQRAIAERINTILADPTSPEALALLDMVAEYFAQQEEGTTWDNNARLQRLEETGWHLEYLQ